MHKVPQPPHPVDRLTTTELSEYIAELKAALERDPTEEQRTLIVGRYREAIMEQNQRAGHGAMRPAAEVTNPDVIKLLEQP